MMESYEYICLDQLLARDREAEIGKDPVQDQAANPGFSDRIKETIHGY